MADVLTTVLQLVGGQQYVRSLNQATQAHQQLAKAQQVQSRAQQQVQAAMAAGRRPTPRQQALAGGAGLPATLPGGIPQLAALAGMAAIATAIKDATNSFIDYDRAVIRTELTMKNMGQNLPTAEFTQFSRTLSLTTGTAEEDLVNLAGYLARFGTNAPTIERGMRIINDAAAYTGKSVEEMAVAFEKARTGNARQFFKDLGIPIKGVSGQLYDLNQIMDIVDQHTHGMAQRMGRELPGQMDKTTAAFKAMGHEAGRLFSPITGGLARIARRSALGYMAFFQDMANRAGIPQAGTTNQAPVPGIGSLGGPGKPRNEEYLRKIEMNTGPQGALGRALRAGGSFGEPGGGLHIRTLNQMLRHHS
jgi:hypothetical protein